MASKERRKPSRAIHSVIILPRKGSAALLLEDKGVHAFHMKSSELVGVGWWS